jgi:uncharacterized membrane protein
VLGLIGLLFENFQSDLTGFLKPVRSRYDSGEALFMNTQKVVRVAIIAALYTVFTLLIAPLSYGPVQFRISEFLKVFVLFDPWIALGIGMGTFIANQFSPFVGPWELIWMPLTDIAGGLMAYFVYRALREKLPAIPMLLYALSTGASVGLMLSVLGVGGFWIMTFYVTASEAVILLAAIPIVTRMAQIF